MVTRNEESCVIMFVVDSSQFLSFIIFEKDITK